MTAHTEQLHGPSSGLQQEEYQQQQQQQMGMASKEEEQQQDIPATDPETLAAGVETKRMNQLRVNSRKNIQVGLLPKQRAASSAWTHMPDYPSFQQQRQKGRMETAATAEREKYPCSQTATLAAIDGAEQRKHFQTRWQAIDGRMQFCTKRVSGSAAVEFNYEFIDRDATYHTWKRMAGGYAPQARSHLECNRFLTVQEDARRSDSLPIVKNRAPPYANPNGPFEARVAEKNYSTNSFHSYRVYHHNLQGALDRTLCPREGEPTEDQQRRRRKGASSIHRHGSSLEISSLQPRNGAPPRRVHSSSQGVHHATDHMYQILQPAAAAAAISSSSRGAAGAAALYQ